MKTLLVGIPAYNALETLPKLIASLKTQTFQDFDICVVSDDDGLSHKYTSLEDDVIVLETKENSGPGIARDVALQYAKDNKYKYITFIDADDVLFTPFALQQLINGFTEPDIAEVYSPFIQVTDMGLIPNTDPTSPWVFGKMYNVDFLKTSNIGFSKLRSMEDGEFNAKIRLLNAKIKVLNDPTYVWMPGSEHSITRTTVEGNDIPVYNYGTCQIGADICFRNAIEFAEKLQPFNPAYKEMATSMMLNHYFTYYEALQNYPEFAELNLDLSAKWYKEVYSKYASTITNDVIENMFMQMFQTKGPTLRKFPAKTWVEWFEDIKNRKYDIQQRVAELPENIKEAYKKSGVYQSFDMEL